MAPAAVIPPQQRHGPNIVPAEVDDALLAEFAALAVPFEAVQGVGREGARLESSNHHRRHERHRLP